MLPAREMQTYADRDPEICRRPTMPAPAMMPLVAEAAEAARVSAHEMPTRPPPMHAVSGIQKAAIRAPRLPSVALEEYGFDRRRDPRAER